MTVLAPADDPPKIDDRNVISHPRLSKLTLDSQSKTLSLFEARAKCVSPEMVKRVPHFHVRIDLIGYKTRFKTKLKELRPTVPKRADRARLSRLGLSRRSPPHHSR